MRGALAIQEKFEMKTAVLAIDVQNGIFKANRPPYESENIVDNICQLISHARKNGNTVIFVQHEAQGVVEYGSDTWKIYDGIAVEETDVRIRKSTPDSFVSTDLDSTLRDAEIGHLIICGYSSDFCIDRTVFRAACSGYRVTLVEDAHTTHDKPHLSAEKIREHHNFILSKHPAVTLMKCGALVSG